MSNEMKMSMTRCMRVTLWIVLIIMVLIAAVEDFCGPDMWWALTYADVIAIGVDIPLCTYVEILKAREGES